MGGGVLSPGTWQVWGLHDGNGCYIPTGRANGKATASRVIEQSAINLGRHVVRADGATARCLTPGCDCLPDLSATVEPATPWADPNHDVAGDFRTWLGLDA